MLIGRTVMMINIGLLAGLENAIGQMEIYMTRLRAVIHECRSTGCRYGYHEYLLLGARDRLDRLRTRHARELEGFAAVGRARQGATAPSIGAVASCRAETRTLVNAPWSAYL